MKFAYKKIGIIFTPYLLIMLLVMGDALAAPLPTHPKFLGLLQLSESNPDQATIKIAEVERNLPSDTKNEDKRELLLLQLQIASEKKESDKVKELVDQLKQLGNTHRDQTALLMAINYQAYMLGIEGKGAEGLALIEPILDATKKSGDSLLISTLETTTGDLYRRIGNFKASLAHHLTSLDSLQTVEEGEWYTDYLHAKTWVKIGVLYQDTRDYATALKFFNKALASAEHTDARVLQSNIVSNLGIIYAIQEKWDFATAAYEKSLVIAKKTGNRHRESIGLNNLADVSLNQKKYSECAQFAEQALHIAQQNGIAFLEAISHGNLGLCRIYQGDIQSGIAEYKLSFNFIKNMQDKVLLVDALNNLALAYKATGLYKEALYTLEEQGQAEDELYKTDLSHALVEMKARFDLTQSQKDIEKLAKKNALQQIEIQNKNLQRTIAAFILLTTLLAIVGLYFLYRKIHNRNLHLDDANAKLKDQSTRDPLTGLLNRRAFENLITSFNLEDGRRKTSGLHDVIVLLDIDHFKRINDTYGHPTGDAVLVEMGKRLQQCLREEDKLMRWGGEEFLIYLHQIKPSDVAEIIGRILLTVGSTLFTEADKTDASVPVTISAGYMLTPLPGALETLINWEQALKLVDLQLYIAKSSGRNQAIGLDQVSGTQEQIDALFAGNLQGSVDNGIISLNCIKGVSTEKTVPTTSPEEANNEICL